MARLRGILPRSQARGRFAERYQYERLDDEEGYAGRVRKKYYQTRLARSEARVKRKVLVLFVMLLAFTAVVVILVAGASGRHTSDVNASGCDSVGKGYQCEPHISHYWGQYSPFYSVESDISRHVPSGCKVTFAQVLSRHGARDPTASKTVAYNETIQKIRANVKKYPGKYAFLAGYEYTMGADQLTGFGEQQLINSGANFYRRYANLANHLTPFVRTASEDRVVESALKWTYGFHDAKLADRSTRGRDSDYPYPVLSISEDEGKNNTLSHGLCTEFENGPDSQIASVAQKEWASVFIPPIQKRINEDLAGADLTATEIIYLMDLCPFSTVASPDGAISTFCNLFTEDEWHQYNYYETLNKYYGYSHGNPLGPTQGVGFANELIARLTDSAVHDQTSTNHTLNDDPESFPLKRRLYADFSHDNDMTAIFSALGLYAGVAPLSNTTITEAKEAKGYSASWTVPFAARAYFEKMKCGGSKEELVRVLVNDRVLPLDQCGGDGLGRCKLSKFVDSLSFASSGGKWDQCFR